MTRQNLPCERCRKRGRGLRGTAHAIARRDSDATAGSAVLELQRRMEMSAVRAWRRSARRPDRRTLLSSTLRATAGGTARAGAPAAPCRTARWRRTRSSLGVGRRRDGFRLQLARCRDDTVGKAGRGANRRAGEKLTKRPRFIMKRTRFGRRSQKSLRSQTLCIRPAGQVLSQPVDQILERSDVHCPPSPASPTLS